MEESSGKSLSYIVGGSSGMGLSTARLLVADGGTVVLVAREQDKLAARKGELEAGGKGKVETITADFYDAGAVKSLIAKIDGETRHINHLVNAAGYFILKNFLEYRARLRRLYGSKSRLLFCHAGRGPEHGEERWRIDRQHRLDVGAPGDQSDAFICLFDAEGRLARPDQEPRDGARRSRDPGKRRGARCDRDTTLQFVHRSREGRANPDRGFQRIPPDRSRRPAGGSRQPHRLPFVG